MALWDHLSGMVTAKAYCLPFLLTPHLEGWRVGGQVTCPHQGSSAPRKHVVKNRSHKTARANGDNERFSVLVSK